MTPLDLFGLFAVTAMLVCYACEHRSPWFILAFAVACWLGSAYGFMQGAWPFGVVEADAANQLPRRPLDDRPLAVSPPLPLAPHLVGVLQRQIEAARRLVKGDLSPFHDFGIPQHGHQRFGVVRHRHPEQQSRGFDGRRGDRHGERESNSNALRPRGEHDDNLPRGS